MERGKSVLSLAKRIVSSLKLYCRKIQIAGSIRRGEKNPGDIDIILIPKNKKKIGEILGKKGRKILGGEQKVFFKIEEIEVELYYTIPEEWGAALLAYSSRRGSGIGLRIIARLNGFKLNQHGLFNRKTGKRIAGKTEEEIYKALGRKWKKPEER